MDRKTKAAKDPIFYECGCIEVPGEFKKFCQDHSNKMGAESKKKFVALVHFKGWSEMALGIAIGLSEPNIEIHLPVIFFKIGWERGFVSDAVLS